MTLLLFESEGDIKYLKRHLSRRLYAVMHKDQLTNIGKILF